MTVLYLDAILSMYLYACACAFSLLQAACCVLLRRSLWVLRRIRSEDVLFTFAVSIFPCSISYIASVIHELYTALLAQNHSQNSVFRL